jgi:hypothetical protein
LKEQPKMAQKLSQTLNVAINSDKNDKSLSQSQFSGSADLINSDKIDENDICSMAESMESFSIEPKKHFNQLETSQSNDDSIQLKNERECLRNLQKLESFYSMFIKDKDLFSNLFILDTKTAAIVIGNKETPHLYMKYYRFLQDEHKIDFLLFYKEATCDWLTKMYQLERNSASVYQLKNYSSLDDFINNLMWIFIRNERYEFANDILEDYVRYLETILDGKRTNDNINEEKNELNLFYSLSNLMMIKSNSNDTQLILPAMKKASIVLDKLRKDNKHVKTTIFNYASGYNLLRQGYFEQSLIYLKKALLVIEQLFNLYKFSFLILNEK